MHSIVNMGKKSSSGPTKKVVPFVSVCTPTFNRRPFIQTMFECFRNQTYPKSRMEWIIVDDGTDKINDLIVQANIPQIKYFALDTKLSLGAKRNYMHEKTKGSIIVYMDDDDYYPPQRVQHAVEMLQKNPRALCAGSSEMYLYFKHINKMYQCGPYGPNHATAGTFAFRRELLNQTQYDPNAALAEEKAFLKNYTIPFVQLDPMKSILVFSHDQNTFDKRKLLAQGENQVFKESTKRVDDFISTTKEEKIYNFFMKDIDDLLKQYEPGTSDYKPDVSEQIKEIDRKREEEAKKQQQHDQNQIIMELPNGEKKVLSNDEIIQIMQRKDMEIRTLMAKVQQLESVVANLQKLAYQTNEEMKSLIE